MICLFKKNLTLDLYFSLADKVSREQELRQVGFIPNLVMNHVTDPNDVYGPLFDEPVENGLATSFANNPIPIESLELLGVLQSYKIVGRKDDKLKRPSQE